MSPLVLVGGLVLCYAALAVMVFAVLAPRGPQVPAARLSAGVTSVTALTQMTNRTVGALERLHKRGWSPVRASTLEQAGVKADVSHFLIFVGAAGLAGAVVGLMLGGPVLALVFVLLAPVGAKLYLAFRTGRRHAKFADQLDDSLQMLAGSMRAGHSLLRAVDAVAQEAESPTREEFARVVNETRLGRDLGTVLESTSERMKCQDFLWVAQAIGVHREVGGDLAEVLDQVGQTIRERNQIRRQVKALSAEGKLSAYVLMALPIGITGFLSLTRPEYVAVLAQSLLGYGLIGLSVVLFTVGALWLRKAVTVKF